MCKLVYGLKKMKLQLIQSSKNYVLTFNPIESQCQKNQSNCVPIEKFMH